MTPMQKKLAAAAVILVIGISMFFLLQEKPGPCRKIRDACEEAGYKFGRTPPERKAFRESCFQPLLQGQQVGNIKIDEDEAATCRDWQSRRRRRGGPNGPPDGGPPGGPPGSGGDDDARIDSIRRLFALAGR